MSGSLNKVQIIGRLGGDPEIRSMSNGRNVANFSVATSERWRDKQTGEMREKTEWAKIVVFNEHLVGICRQYLTKGSHVFIEGKMQTRQYEQDGVTKYMTEVVLSDFKGELVMLGGGEQQDREPQQRQQRQQRPAQDDLGFPDDGAADTRGDFEDSIPF